MLSSTEPMMLTTGKHYHFNKAKQLLATRDKDSLRYCALELRTCIELLCYERMSIYTDELSPEHLKQWRPSHVVDLLLQCDPDSDQDCSISIAKELPDGTNGPRRVLGSFRGITKRFVNKNYHRLGAYLHAPTLSDMRSGTTKTIDEIRISLQETLSELEPFLHNTMVNIASFFNFTCEICGSRNKRNLDSLSNGCIAKCIGPSCHAQYEISHVDSDTPIASLLRTPWQCAKCNKANSTHSWEVRLGEALTCTSCQTKYLVSCGLVPIEEPKHMPSP